MLDAVFIENCRLLIQTLGHSLWQASIVAVFCWLALRRLPARRSETRYAVVCGGLVAVVLAMLVTAAAVFTSATTSTGIDAETGPRSNVPTSNSHSLLTDQTSMTVSRLSDPRGLTEVVPPSHSATSHAVEAHVTAPKADDRRPASTTSDITKQSQFAWPALAAGVWGIGVLTMLFRLVRVIVALRNLRASSESVDDTRVAQIREVMAELSRRMKLRWPVSLMISDKVSVPGIVGTYWPTLLLPPAMLTGVPIEQLRIVIAHELAHARRYDFLVNLGQLLVESFLFFNPAVWWLTRQIRIEREACCDALAVAATGSAVPVARTLLAIVEQLTESLGIAAASEFANAAGVQSFVGDEPPESTTPLFDRVRRIVTPDQRPHIQVPWYTLLGVVVAYALVSFGLYEGADATVQVVQRALSPKERVEKIEALIEAKGELARREGVPVYSSDEPEPGSLFPEPVTVSGIVRTSDGSPLPVPLTIYGTFSGPGIGATEGFANFNEPASEFLFSGKTRSQKSVRGDTATLGLHIGFRRDTESAKRFAPAAVGPFTIRSGQVIDNLEIILKPGFTGQLRVVDSSNKPIGNAFVSGMFHLDNASSYARLGESRSETNPDGTTTIPACTSKLTWTADIRAAGFQTAKYDLNLQPGVISTIKMKPARPTTIKIESDTDGQPVSGAFAYVTAEHPNQSGQVSTVFHRDPREESIQEYESQYAGLYRYGPSNSNGILTLDALAASTTYDLLIMKSGFGPTFLKEIKAGAELIDLTLHPELTVSGRIIGDLSALRTRGRSKQKHIRYRNVDRYWIAYADVEERDGKGYFEIKNLVRGDLRLQFPDRTIALELTESISDLVIDLTQPPEKARPYKPIVEKLPEPQGPQRRVILNLVGADPSVPITGKFRAGYLTRSNSGGYSSAELDIVDAKVEFNVEVPTKIV